MLEPHTNRKKSDQWEPVFRRSRTLTSFLLYFGLKVFFLIMFSVTVSSLLVFFLLIFSTSSLGHAVGEAEERKNFKTIFDLLIGISKGFYFENGLNPSTRLDCPLCDSSVYSYCSEKLLHDACCCLNPYDHKLPHQCKYADCGFLHANSCREHKLITACCCSKLI